MILAGDIGGTKSELALFGAATGPRAPLRRATYASQQFPNLEAIVRDFLRGEVRAISSACFGVAGPVVGGRARITNLPWLIEEEALRAELGVAEVLLLNDVQATAFATPSLRPDEFETIVDGEARPRGAIAVIAPGTGLGEAFLLWDGARYRAYPSEGGHVDFAPGDEDQLALLAHLRRTYQHVSYERVCSGIGIPNIYDFLRATAEVVPPAAEPQLLGSDRARAIINGAMTSPVDPLCVKTTEMFVAILGAEAGNLALKVMATGGVYIAGGIPRAILPLLRSGGFQDAFREKGRLSDLVSAIPVHVITGDAALIGAAIAGLAAEVERGGGPAESSAP